jgi:hypothetical protein
VSAGSSWRPDEVQTSARWFAWALAVVALLGWGWFVVALGGVSVVDGSIGGRLPVTVAFAVALFGTTFSAAMTVVAWVASLAGEAVVRIDQDAKRRLTAQP